MVTHPLVSETFDGADTIVLVTPQPEFVDFDYAAVVDRMAHPVVVDDCGAFYREFEAVGFRYHGLASPSERVLAERSLAWRFDHPWTPLEDIGRDIIKMTRLGARTPRQDWVAWGWRTATMSTHEGH